MSGAGKNLAEGAAAAGKLSIDGRCKTLDRRANGYVRSEGVGAFVLQPADGGGARWWCCYRG